ncbi:phosphatase PAP2 family protein [Planococcus salinus]|uniref:Phosphatase PAP2 family protein n=1 Tax=Planococcus salinus TaxID=1848460 RepID=A0A3M8P6J5_9BACL|nr:phosphatase PAP2 family protein [Planococcus salinus]RNF39232.1 phosphatase PAP2 family protein [Planococcus salinus]
MATLLGFFAILLYFSSEPLRRIDRNAASAIGGTGWLDALSIIGDQWVIITISLLLILYLWVFRQNYRGMLFVFLSVGVGNVINQLLKQTFERQRPDFPHGLETFSFPSNHAMVGLLYLFTVAYFLSEDRAGNAAKWLVWLVAIVLAGAVGLSRVAGMEHYLSDVAAGWFAGYSWFVAVAVWYEMRERLFRKRPVNEEK